MRFMRSIRRCVSVLFPVERFLLRCGPNHGRENRAKQTVFSLTVHRISTRYKTSVSYDSLVVFILYRYPLIIYL